MAHAYDVLKPFSDQLGTSTVTYKCDWNFIGSYWNIFLTFQEDLNEAPLCSTQICLLQYKTE